MFAGLTALSLNSNVVDFNQFRSQRTAALLPQAETKPAPELSAVFSPSAAPTTVAAPGAGWATGPNAAPNAPRTHTDVGRTVGRAAAATLAGLVGGVAGFYGGGWLATGLGDLLVPGLGLGVIGWAVWGALAGAAGGAIWAAHAAWQVTR